MNVKNFLLAGIAGGITDFLLGWVFYGMLFHEYFGSANPNLPFIFGGCLFFRLLVSYIYVKWAQIGTFMPGAKGGIVLGAIVALMQNCFQNSMIATPDFMMIGVDVGIGIVIGAGVGAIVGMVNGALSKKST